MRASEHEITDELRDRIREIMSDGVERHASDVEELVECRRVLVRAALSQLVEQGIVHVVRVDLHRRSKIYRFGSPPAVRRDSWWTEEQRAANAAFDAMVRAGRRE